MWVERQRSRREEREKLRELLRELLRRVVKFRRLAALQPPLDSPAQRLADYWNEMLESSSALLDHCLEVEAFGPTGLAHLAGLALDDTRAASDALKRGDRETARRYVELGNERTIVLIDVIRLRLGLPRRERRWRLRAPWRRRRVGATPGASPPETPRISGEGG